MRKFQKRINTVFGIIVVLMIFDGCTKNDSNNASEQTTPVAESDNRDLSEKNGTEQGVSSKTACILKDTFESGPYRFDQIVLSSKLEFERMLSLIEFKNDLGRRANFVIESIRKPVFEKGVVSIEQQFRCKYEKETSVLNLNASITIPDNIGRKEYWSTIEFKYHVGVNEDWIDFSPFTSGDEADDINKYFYELENSGIKYGFYRTKKGQLVLQITQEVTEMDGVTRNVHYVYYREKK